jgi:hypothetical protein
MIVEFPKHKRVRRGPVTELPENKLEFVLARIAACEHWIAACEEELQNLRVEAVDLIGQQQKTADLGDLPRPGWVPTIPEITPADIAAIVRALQSRPELAVVDGKPVLP